MQSDNQQQSNPITSTHQQQPSTTIPQQQQAAQQQQITPQTLQHFNQICLQATQLMNNYKNQSIALKQEIAGMVNIYQKNTQGTDAVPVQKIIQITQQYQQGMKQANKQYHHLAQELKIQQQQRDNIMLQIKDCFDKLQRMQTKIKAKKLQQQQKLKQQSQKTQNQQSVTGQQEENPTQQQAKHEHKNQ